MKDYSSIINLHKNLINFNFEKLVNFNFKNLIDLNFKSNCSYFRVNYKTAY